MKEEQGEILKSLIQLTKWAGSFEELEAIKTCLNIFKLENRKNSNLFRICEEIEGAIYQRTIDIRYHYQDKNQY